MIRNTIVKTFQNNAARIASLKKPAAADRKWLADYCLNHHKLVLPASEVKSDTSDKKNKSAPSELPNLKMNELVKRPQPFSGRQPARQWIDDYEKCSEVNGWSKPLMVKYFLVRDTSPQASRT